jgi:hypothetical protein
MLDNKIIALTQGDALLQQLFNFAVELTRSSGKN